MKLQDGTQKCTLCSYSIHPNFGNTGNLTSHVQAVSKILQNLLQPAQFNKVKIEQVRFQGQSDLCLILVNWNKTKVSTVFLFDTICRPFLKTAEKLPNLNYCLKYLSTIY